MKDAIKRCPRCGVTKVVTDFYRDASRKDGRAPACKQCRRAAYERDKDRTVEYRKRHYRENRERYAELNKKWREDNHEHHKRAEKAYTEANRDRKREYDKTYRERREIENPGARRRAKVKHRYGITWDEFMELVRSQDGKCAICERALHDKKCIDHDHETGDVRGVLCPSCNFAIGFLQDNPEVALRASAYLAR